MITLILIIRSVLAGLAVLFALSCTKVDEPDTRVINGDWIAFPDKDVNIGGSEKYTFRQIAELAFKVLNKKAKISSLPVWMIKIILPLMRTFTSSRTYGPVEFVMSIMTMDVIGEPYGKERLEDFFKQESLV